MTFIGTFFLWCLFPSFNGVNPMHNYQYLNSRYLAIGNTFWALSSSVFCSFIMSMILKNGKLWIEHIWNATLAGGIIISASADLFSVCWPPLLIGAFGGIISTLWFTYLSRIISHWYLFDTRGILFLHLIPSLFGAIVASITFSWFDNLSLADYYGGGSLLSQYFMNGRSGLFQGGL